MKSKSTEKSHMANSGLHMFDGASCAGAEASLEFGRFQVLPRQRILLANGVRIELGSRAFEVLLALLEADGALVTKRAAAGACLAGDRRHGTKPEGSDLCVAEGVWRRPRLYPHRIWPRLPVHCRNSLKCCPERTATPSAAAVLVDTGAVPESALSATVVRLVD